MRGVAFGGMLLLLLSAASADEFLLSNFNQQDFDYTYGGFASTPGPTSLRLYDSENGWGGAGVNQSMDLSSLADARLVADFSINPAHGADFFQLHLNDADGLSGRWVFNTSTYSPGEAVSLSSGGTLSAPNSVYDSVNGAFVDTLPDLSRITGWSVEGQWDSPALFDLNFDNFLISTEAEPPPPYAGYEADAPWRAEAATRIDAVRKADLVVRVVDALGNPLPGATVNVEQASHEFGFGSAVRAARLRDDAPGNAAYKAKVAELFNLATIENNLKWPPWEGEWGSNFTQAGVAATLQWLASERIDARGHVMVWPGASNLPQDLQTLLASGPLDAGELQQLRDRIAGRIADVSAATEGQLVAWDVVNEPRANHDVMDVLPEGDDAMATWFQLARAANPEAKLFLNEYGILTSGGGTNTANQQLLANQAIAIRDAGAPIDGVGLQGHFNDDSLTGPEQLWQIVDRYADLGLDVQITEFDHGTDDEALQAAYLRDFFTAMFAHEGVTDLVMWGFWAGDHYDPERALFREDWSAKPSGQAYLDLVLNEWWTDQTAAAGDAGEATVRAFKGEHNVDAEFGGESATGEATLSDDGATVTLTLALLQGDYNRDGAVDAADYTVWRDSLDQTVAARGLGADGDGDGVIGPGDLAVWRNAYGSRLPATLAVPEPGALSLAVLASGTLLRQRP